MKRKKVERIIDRLALGLFLLSTAFVVFGYGVIVGRYQIFPFNTLLKMQNAIQVSMGLYQNPELKPHHLYPIWYDYSGVRIHNANSIMRGVTLLTSYWPFLDWKPGIVLIDSTGEILHMWETDPSKIWPTSPYTDHVKGSLNTSENYVHGCYLFENGDIIFNIEYMGLVRMNVHGEVLWTLPYRTHHSVSRDQDGCFWVCGLKWIEDNPEGRERLTHYAGLNLPIAEDFALKVTEDGEILREISILKVLYENGYQQLIRQMSGRRTGDILHTNKVEALRSDIADQYTLFDAGDIVVSSRVLNSIFVLDTETEKIKWLCNRFLLQHDPDFLDNGWICVFDNNADIENENVPYPGGSRIIAVNPGNNEMRTLYPKTNEQEFFTGGGGKVQNLPNGNLLITEARRGRVFETDPSGRVVWEWVHEKYNSDFIPEVLEGTRYFLTRQRIAEWRTK